jgi:excisionase family DNA binding protein
MRLDWGVVRDEYVRGRESYKEIAARFGVCKNAIDRHGGDVARNGGLTWPELREQFRSRRAEHDDLATRISLVRDGLLTISDAAKHLSRSTRWLQKELLAGKMPFVQLGSDRLIPRGALDHYLATRLQNVEIPLSVLLDALAEPESA